jgi:hypothetical protein
MKYCISINNKRVFVPIPDWLPLDNPKNRKALLLIALIITSLTLTLPINNSQTAQGDSGTQVGGTLIGNTTWTAANSPYIITQTIIVPANVYLTIEPDVTITIQSSDTIMFQINGIINGRGNATDKIIFDGGGNANFFRTNHPVVAGFLSLDYCMIRNGLSAFWFDNTAYLNLTNCELSNLSVFSYLWYPSQDVHIEYNTFTNCSGIKIGTDDYFSNSSGMVYIRHNLFTNNQGFIINNYASYGLSKISFNFNSFSGTSGVIMEVEQTSTTADMDASQNFWGTSNTTTIDSMIYDNNDDASCTSLIDYDPILDAPDPEAPVAPTPSPLPIPTTTPEPLPSPSTSPDPSTTPLPSTEPMITPTPTTSPINSPTPEPTANTSNQTSISTSDSSTDSFTPDSSPNPSATTNLSQPSSSTNPQGLPTKQPNATSSPPVFDASKNYIQIVVILALVIVAVGLTIAFVKRKW